MLKEKTNKTAEAAGSLSNASVRRLSLRDPAGSLYEVDGHLFRVLSIESWPLYEEIFSSFIVKKLVQEGKIVETRILDNAEANTIAKRIADLRPEAVFTYGKILEHKKIEFVAYPHEWCSEMLRDAGLLTLEIADRLLAAGLGLKDATPFNVIFDGARPVFIDVLSIEKRESTNPTWMAYGQFCRTFVNTLLLSKHFNISFERSLANHRDGLPSETVYSFLSFFQKLLPPFLTKVTLPVLLSKFHDPNQLEIYQNKKTSKELADFTLRYLYSSLKKTLLKMCKKSMGYGADTYMEKQLPYTQEQFDEKSSKIKVLLEQIKPQKILDIGCNTGYFSMQAAKLGAKVVSIDNDTSVVSDLYKSTKTGALNILPLQMDITSPSPATGWENDENRSFMSRAAGTYDTVLMLALVHHLQTTHAIPLEAIASLTAKLTNKWAVIEFISPEDPIFKCLARGRDYSHATEVYFEKIFGTLFSVEQKIVQKNNFRTLYLLKKN